VIAQRRMTYANQIVKFWAKDSFLKDRSDELLPEKFIDLWSQHISMRYRARC
jgi:hypothetical protein